jgi:cytochrome c551/c552
MTHSHKTLITLSMAACLIPFLSSCATTAHPIDITGLQITPGTASITSNNGSLVNIVVVKGVNFLPGASVSEPGKDCNARIEYGNGEPDDTLILKTAFTATGKVFKQTGTYTVVVSGDKSKGQNACEGEAKAILVVDASADVMNNLGYKYALGDGVPQSDAEAVKWYRKAAAKGNAMATYNLGFMYEHGRGVEQHISKAFSLYQSAARKGNYEAMQSLGRMYADGRGDRITGYAWATLAEERAIDQQDKIESLLLVDQIGKTLSNKEIARAKKISKKLSGMIEKYQNAEEKRARIAANQQVAHDEQPHMVKDNFDNVVFASQQTAPESQSRIAAEQTGRDSQYRDAMIMLASKFGCFACHAIDIKKIGPSFADISKRYKKEPMVTFQGTNYSVRDYLAYKVSLGSSGAWGSLPMPPIDRNGSHQGEIIELVEFVMGLEITP